MDTDTDSLVGSDESTDCGDGGDSLGCGDCAGDGGFSDAQGDDGGSSDDTGTDQDGACGSVNDTTGGDWGSFDPSVATDSVFGGSGDIGTSLWHAAGHVATGIYDNFASNFHGLEAAADAFLGDGEATGRRMYQAAADAADMRSQFHQAGQDLWGR